MGIATVMLLALGNAALERSFDAWVVEHGKNYSTPARVQTARLNYAANEKVIAELNHLEMGTAEYGHVRTQLLPSAP